MWSQIQEKEYSTTGSDEATRVIEGDSRKAKLIVEWAGKDKRIIDLGCNDGGIANELKKRGNTVFGFDFPKVAILARKKYNLDAAAADFSYSLPIRSSSADVIIASAVLEHVPDDKLFLTECHRVLKPGGRVIIVIPNIAYLKNRIKLLIGYRMFDHVNDVNTHIHSLYTLSGFTALLEHLGFKVTRTAGSHFKVENKNIDLWYILEQRLPPSFSAELVVEAQKND